jgi:telomere length regulation protein
MLHALAMGARELASLSAPDQAVTKAFASRTLPPAQHKKFLTDGTQHSSPVLSLLDVIVTDAAGKEKNEIENSTHLTKERRLRIRKAPGITPVVDGRQQAPIPHQKTTFNSVATEFFIMPLLNRFWNFLRDEQSREERTAALDGRSRYRGAGTGLILNPVVLSQFLGTLAILLHAARAIPEWLAVIAPDALELAITVGSRPVSGNETEGEDQGKEASVLTSALELALVIIDGCSELDRGKSLGLDHPELLLAAGEWASAVFTKLEDGVRVSGGGGVLDIRLRRASASVLLKVESITSQWRRSMVEW